MTQWTAPTPRAVLVVFVALLCAALFLSNSLRFITAEVNAGGKDEAAGSKYVSYAGMGTNIREVYK